MCANILLISILILFLSSIRCEEQTNNNIHSVKYDPPKLLQKKKGFSFHRSYHHHHQHYHDLMTHGNNDNCDSKTRGGNVYLNITQRIDCPIYYNVTNGFYTPKITLCNKGTELQSGELYIDERFGEMLNNYTLNTLGSGWECTHKKCINKNWLAKNDCYPLLQPTFRFKCINVDECDLNILFSASGRDMNFEKIEANNVQGLITCGGGGTNSGSLSCLTSQLGCLGSVQDTPTQKSEDINIQPTCCNGYSSYSLALTSYENASTPFNYELDLTNIIWPISDSQNMACINKSFTIFIQNLDNLTTGCDSLLPPPTISSTVIENDLSEGLDCNGSICISNFNATIATLLSNLGSIKVIFSLNYDLQNSSLLGCCIQPIFAVDISTACEECQDIQVSINVDADHFLPAQIGNTSISTISKIGLGNTNIQTLCYANATLDECNMNFIPFQSSCNFEFDVTLLGFSTVDGKFNATFRSILKPMDFPSSPNQNMNTSFSMLIPHPFDVLISCPSTTKLDGICEQNSYNALNSSTICERLQTDCKNSKGLIQESTKLLCIDNSYSISMGMSRGEPMIVDFSYTYSKPIEYFLGCEFHLTVVAQITEPCNGLDGPISCVTSEIFSLI